MKKASPIHSLLKRMARIARMERGTLCRMAGRPHYNHQTWQDGRNVSRYVPLEDLPAVQDAIEGYRQYMKLAEEYANIVIRRTRAERVKTVATRPHSTPKRPPPSPTRARRNPGKDV